MGFGLLDEDEVSILKGTQKIKQKKEKVSAHKVDLTIKKKPEIKIDYNYIIPEDEKVQLNKKVPLNPELYQDFTEELYPYSLNFYDFEVFVHDWFITIINPIELIMRVIVNDLKALTDYYNKHKN